MTRLPDLIRAELTALADSSEVPADLGARAIAGGRRRRRRFGATLAAAVAAAGVTLVLVGVSLAGGLAPAARPAANAVFAYFSAPGARQVPRWHVLDPVTGDYRSPDVATVTAPTTDLHYAAVAPPWTGSVGPDMPADRRIGRYDTTTGAIRWYDIPVQLGTAPRISPDGRYAAAAVENHTERPEDKFDQLVILDLASGRAAVVSLSAADAAAAVYPDHGSPAGFAPGDGLTWRADSRHLMVGTAIVDLTGHHTGQLRLPVDSRLVSVRPDGSAALVDPTTESFDPNSHLVLVDGSGAVTHRAGDRPCWRPPPPSDLPSDYLASIEPSPGFDPASPEFNPSPGPSSPAYKSYDPSAPPRTGSVVFSLSPVGEICGYDYGQFVGWRGPTTVLMAYDNSIDAFDFASGVRRPLRPVSRDTMLDGQLAMVVVAADGLSDRARGRVAF